MASKKAANYIFIFSLCMCGVTDLLVPLCERSLAFYINGAAYGLALGEIFFPRFLHYFLSKSTDAVHLYQVNFLQF